MSLWLFYLGYKGLPSKGEPGDQPITFLAYAMKETLEVGDFSLAE